MKPASIKPVRCAIYTRVSTEQGLDQEFNSLDAQYDAASAYIKSQARAGWALIRSRYDDGYKVDRLTRSLADFAKLVELFDAQGVSFVSVTLSAEASDPFATVFGVVLNRRAAAVLLSPPSTALRTIASRPFGVRDAFLWVSIRFSANRWWFGDFRIPGQGRMDNLLKAHS
jgi:hypothetical protein